MVDRIAESSKTDSKTGFLEESVKRIPNELPKLSVSQLIQQAKKKITERHSSRSKGSGGGSNQERPQSYKSPGSRKSIRPTGPVGTSPAKVLPKVLSFNETTV